MRTGRFHQHRIEHHLSNLSNLINTSSVFNIYRYDIIEIDTGASPMLPVVVVVALSGFIYVERNSG